MHRRFPLFSLAIAVVAVGIQLVPGAVDTLQFDRSVCLREPWRLVSAHLTHFGWNHLAWDVAVWLVLGILCERASRVRVVLATAISSVAITSAILLWQPQFQTYRGLSGLDFALFGLFVGSILERRDRGGLVLGIVALAAAAGKCVFELATASTLFASGHGYAPVPLAHAVGLGVGVAAGLLGWRRRRQVALTGFK